MAVALLRPVWRALALACTLSVSAGGWAVITLDDLPDSAVAGKPLTLAFAVRQHGITLLAGLHPAIEAVAGGQRLRADAVAAGAIGHYTTTLTLPDTGVWQLTVYSGFGNNQVELMPIQAVASDQTAPAITAAERGQHLFVAKGCVTCHLHNAVPGSGKVQVGPELTAIRLPADFLEKFLADPSIAPVAQGTTFRMPNLNLKDSEIAALAAFLNSTGETARTGQ